jgi:hypothetical protein
MQVSSPEELPLQALPEPDVNLSAHPAPTFQPVFLRIIPKFPMHKQFAILFSHFGEPFHGSSFMSLEIFVFVHQPVHEALVESIPDGFHCIAIKPTIVVKPTLQHRIKTRRQVFEGLINSKLNVPAPNGPDYLFSCRIAKARRKVCKASTYFVDCFSGSKSEPKKVKLDVFRATSAVNIFAIDYASLTWMNFQSKLRESILETRKQVFCLCSSFAVQKSIVSIPCKGY